MLLSCIQTENTGSNFSLIITQGMVALAPLQKH